MRKILIALSIMTSLHASSERHKSSKEEELQEAEMEARHKERIERAINNPDTSFDEMLDNEEVTIIKIERRVKNLPKLKLIMMKTGINMIFDHIVLIICDHKKSKDFYSKALLPLGINFVRETDGCVGFGTNGKPSLWLCEEKIIQNPMHIALIAENRKSIDAFHKAAIAAGGKDNGAPGIREHYNINYYSAYVIDPDGHNIEAVCRKPE